MFFGIKNYLYGINMYLSAIQSIDAKAYTKQVKLQLVALFGNYRWLFHVLFLILTNFLYMGKLNYKEYSLVTDITAIEDFLLYRSIIRWLCAIGLIYGYFLIVIPLAKIIKTTPAFIILIIINSLLYIGIYNISIHIFSNYHLLAKALSVPHWYNINGTIYQSVLFVQWSFLSMWYFVEIFLHQKKINNYAAQLQMQVQAEKTFLQQQINPHFLFNTLNNIYAASMQDKPKAYLLTKGLNQLLQYMTTDAMQEIVYLKEEINFINNYLYLEKARNIETSLQVIFNVKGNIDTVKLAPLLLINFIENAFKHGVKAGIDKSTITITITVVNNTIYFECINSKPSNTNNIASNIDTNKGIGIQNIKKRLELIYPAKHTLKIIENNNIYAVHLTLVVENE